MTKLRAPLTVENALTKIAGLIGFAAMAESLTTPGRPVAERTVRNWSDPDTPERCPIEAGIRLDVAYQAAGGDGAPIYETYGLLLDAAHAEHFADEAELARRTISAIKEGGEAHAALVAASRPGATALDRRAALREVEQGVAALTSTLPLLTEGAVPHGSRGEGPSPGGEP